MFVPVILEFENNGLKFMLLKYLRFLDLCMKNGWPIITHEEFDKYEINFPNRNEYNKEMVNRYGYSLYSYEERKKVHHYFLPSGYYKEIEQQKGSGLERAIYLINEQDDKLENKFKEFLEDILIKEGNIEAVLYFASCPLSLKNICREMEIPMIAYETGPIRKSNYRCDTSYFCRNGLYDVSEIEKRWNAFYAISMENNKIQTFSREEILCMFLDKNSLGYLSQINRSPQYEAGIAGGHTLVVPYFAINKYMDHELIDEVFEIYDYSKVEVRLHPGDVYTASYRLSKVDKAESPFVFLINAKRICAVGSNMLFEAMMWKRIACSKVKVMPASIFCSTNYGEKHEKNNIELFVNFFIFSFLTPMELACDEEYIRWRLTNPTEDEIYNFNLNYYLKKFGLNIRWLSLDSNKRIEFLKMHRGFHPMTDDEFEKKLLIAMKGNNHSEENDDTCLEDENYYLKYIETKEWLENVLNSSSWKITEPIRFIFDKMRRLK